MSPRELTVKRFTLSTYMATKLYIGGLAWATDDQSLEAAFSAAGTVVSAKVITDRETGRSRGFGFVEMSSDEEAQKAITMMNGQEVDGRAISVSEARHMDASAPRGGSRGGFSGGNRNNDRDQGNRW